MDINLVAFPDQTLKGEVILINPAEELIEGIVYYKVMIDLEEETEGVKPGMTADISIKTGKKENVLVVPKGAVKKINGKTIIEVFKDAKVEEREIEVGLKGNDFYEVVSGLEKGEQIITGKR